MCQSLGGSSVQEINHILMSVGRCAVVVQPEILSSPQLRASSSDVLSEPFHNAKVVIAIDTMPIGYKFTHDDSLRVPEDDQHHFADVPVSDTLLGSTLVAGKPCLGAHVCLGLVTGEPGFISCHNTGLHGGSTQEMPLGVSRNPESCGFLVVCQEMGYPLCGALLQFQLVPQDVMNCSEGESCLP